MEGEVMVLIKGHFHRKVPESPPQQSSLCLWLALKLDLATPDTQLGVLIQATCLVWIAILKMLFDTLSRKSWNS